MGELVGGLVGGMTCGLPGVKVDLHIVLLVVHEWVDLQAVWWVGGGT